MDFDYSRGFSFYKGGHLWVVIAELQAPERVVVVSLNSQKQYSDTTVVFQKGDHPFIKRPTVVTYAYTQIYDKAYLDARIKQRDFATDERFQQDKVEQMQTGLLRSPHTPNGIKSLCKQAFENKLPLSKNYFPK